MGTELARPDRRAFWGTWALVMAICARRRVPFLAALLTAELAAAGAMKAWQAAEDLHALAGAAAAPPAPDLAGFTTGEPAHGQ